MTEVKVWAPKAQKVELALGSARIPMQRRTLGWWTAVVPPNPPFDYAFVLDGGSPLPDLRSQSQPFGVNGASRTVDHASFRWIDQTWQPPPLCSAVIYELHIGTFTEAGTFDAAVERIPYLLDLGITHVELMPVAEFPGTWGWGYDGVALFAPHQACRGPDGLKRLVNALHANGVGRQQPIHLLHELYRSGTRSPGF